MFSFWQKISRILKTAEDREKILSAASARELIDIFP